MLFAVSLPISHVPAQFGIGFALIGWIIEGLYRRNWRFVWHPFLGFLAFYIGWNMISAVCSPRPLHSLNAVGDNEWPLLIMLMMFWTIDDRKLMKRMVVLYLATSSLAMLYAIWQTFAGIELYRHLTLDWLGGYYRAVGFYGFYLTFAAFAMTVFFLSLSIALEVKTNRLAGLMLAAVSLFAIVGSFARSIWLSLALGIPIIGFLKNRKLGIIVCSALLLVGLIGIAAVPTIRTRAESILDLSQNQTRLNLWKTSLNIAKDRLILGGGEDNFDYFFPLYRVNGDYDTTVHPHNDYLTVLVASGIPGLLAFLGMWVTALRSGLKTWRESSDAELKAISLGSSFSLIGFLVGSFFQNYYGTFANCLGWWFMVGLILSSCRLATEESGHRRQTSS
jgi:O-antigen ligase